MKELNKVSVDLYKKAYSELTKPQKRKAVIELMIENSKVPLTETELIKLAKPKRLYTEWQRRLNLAFPDPLYVTDGKLVIIDKEVTRKIREQWQKKNSDSIIPDHIKPPVYTQVIPKNIGTRAVYVTCNIGGERNSYYLIYRNENGIYSGFDAGYLAVIYKHFPNTTMSFTDNKYLAVFQIEGVTKAVLMPIKLDSRWNN